MCDNCNRRALVALEAIANGEEIPEPEPAETEVQLADYALPFPVMVSISDNGFVGIITNEVGWETIQAFLASIGRPAGD